MVRPVRSKLYESTGDEREGTGEKPRLNFYN